MSLVTLEQAKDHLHIEQSNTDSDSQVELQIESASAIVLDYLKVAEDNWQDSNGLPVDVPAVIRAATLLVLGSLFENRDGSDKEAVPISTAVENLLRRYRDPALA